MDRKRVYGPEESVKPLSPRPDVSISSVQRKDGRSDWQMRKLFAKHNVISQASGSAYLESGNTKVLVAVYGPRPVTKGKENFERGQIVCEMKYACFSTAKRSSYAPVLFLIHL